MIYTERLWNFKNSLLFKLRKTNILWLLALVVLFNLALSLIVAFVSNKAGYSISANFLPFESIKEEFIVVVIIAPFLETTFYQYFLIEFVLFITRFLFKKESILLAVLIPAIAFAMSHQYNYIYVANTLIAGISLNLFYIIVKLRKQNAFICTVIVHAIYNLFVFALRNT